MGRVKVTEDIIFVFPTLLHVLQFVLGKSPQTFGL